MARCGHSQSHSRRQPYFLHLGLQCYDRNFLREYCRMAPTPLMVRGCLLAHDTNCSCGRQPRATVLEVLSSSRHRNRAACRQQYATEPRHSTPATYCSRWQPGQRRLPRRTGDRHALRLLRRQDLEAQSEDPRDGRLHPVDEGERDEALSETPPLSGSVRAGAGRACSRAAARERRPVGASQAPGRPLARGRFRAVPARRAAARRAGP